MATVYILWVFYDMRIPHHGVFFGPPPTLVDKNLSALIRHAILETFSNERKENSTFYELWSVCILEIFPLGFLKNNFFEKCFYKVSFSRESNYVIINIKQQCFQLYWIWKVLILKHKILLNSTVPGTFRGYTGWSEAKGNFWIRPFIAKNDF